MQLCSAPACLCPVTAPTAPASPCPVTAPPSPACPCSTPRSLSHYLSDKRKNDRAVLEMAGKLTQQLAAGGGGARAAAAARSDEGLKAVVAAYEAKQAELGKENRDLKAALASLQVGRRCRP